VPVDLCNEVVRELDVEAQCAFAAALGYDGLELAPFTLAPSPLDLDSRAAARIASAAREAGIAIGGLHWLLVAPPGLSITSGDPSVRESTIDVATRLVAFAADVGARVLVHGSPGQRRLPPGDLEGGRRRGVEFFARMAELAADAGVTYCIEPLAAAETDFVTSVAEAAAIVEAVAAPSLRTMIDTRAASLGEREPLEALLDRWLPTGLVAHVHLNDRGGRGPGQGSDRFAGVLAALARHDYRGRVGIEPFEYVPDGRAAAARAIGYVRGLYEALDWGRPEPSGGT
jgi:D-psicose/D-tagatose/L-ribulose 3-epimerase